MQRRVVSAAGASTLGDGGSDFPRACEAASGSARRARRMPLSGSLVVDAMLAALAIVIVTTVVALIALWPTGGPVRSPSIAVTKTEGARVTDARDVYCGIAAAHVCEVITAELTSGRDKGTSTRFDFLPTPGASRLIVGDRVRLMRNPPAPRGTPAARQVLVQRLRPAHAAALARHRLHRAPARDRADARLPRADRFGRESRDRAEVRDPVHSPRPLRGCGRVDGGAGRPARDNPAVLRHPREGRRRVARDRTQPLPGGGARLDVHAPDASSARRRRRRSSSAPATPRSAFRGCCSLEW